MDESVRNLQRRAAVDSAAQVALDAALDRLGRHALLYRGPDPVPQRVTSPPVRDSAGSRIGWKKGHQRHRVSCAASVDALDRSVERVARRVGRAQCAEGLAEYYAEQG